MQRLSKPCHRFTLALAAQGQKQLARRARQQSLRRAGRVAGLEAVRAHRADVLLVEQVAHVQLQRQVPGKAQRLELVAGRQAAEPERLHAGVVGVGVVALARVLAAQAREPRAVVVRRFRAEQGFRRAGHLLAIHAHQVRAVQIVRLVLGVVIRGRVEPADLTVEFPHGDRFHALGVHLADVHERGRATDDAGACGHAQLAVVEAGAVHGQRALQRRALEAVAEVDIGRGFRLQVGDAGVVRGLGLRERTAHARLVRAHVFRSRRKHFVVLGQRVIGAHLRQEVFLGRQLAGRAVADNVAGGNIHLHALEAGVEFELAVHQRQAVLQVVLRRGGDEVLLPVDLERVRQIVHGVGRAGGRIVGAGARVVGPLAPGAERDRVLAQRQARVGHDAVAADAVFGGADRQRIGGVGGHVRRVPVAFALVVVVVAGGLELEGRGQVQFQDQAAQVVLAQAAGRVIGVVQTFDVARVLATGGIDGALPVGLVVVPVVTEAADHFLRHILVIDFLAVRVVEEAGQAVALAKIEHEAGIDLVLVLAAGALGLVGALARAAKKSLDGAADQAGIDAGKRARRRIAAPRLRQREPALVAGRQRVELHRASQVAGGRGSQRTGALRHLHAADVFRRHGAADVQAVVVGVAHVAERDAVQRKAQLALAEAAQAERGGPLVRAKRIGRLEVYARQLIQDFQRAGARQRFGQVVLVDVLHLARLAAPRDFHGLDRTDHGTDGGAVGDSISSVMCVSLEGQRLEHDQAQGFQGEALGHGGSSFSRQASDGCGGAAGGKFQQGGRRDRPRDMVALQVVAAHFFKDGGLAGRFHAFGHQFQPQRVAHGDDGVHQAVAALAVLDIHDKRAVDLERVQVELGEVAERGITGAEVVQRHAHAQRPQAVEHGVYLAAVVDQHALGQFQLELARLQAVARQRLRHQSHERGIGQLPGRDVDAGDDRAQRAVVPERHLAACLVQHPAAHGHHHAIVFGHRDEPVGRHVAQLRIVPADQRLHLGQPARAGVHDGLVHQAEFVVVDGAAQGAVDHQRILGGRVHRIVEGPHFAPPRLLGLIHGDVGIAHQHVAVGAMGRVTGHADAGRHPDRVVRQVEPRGKGGNDVLGAPARGILGGAGGQVGNHDDEFVAAEARQQVVGAQDAKQALGGLAQQLVAGRVAERIVDALELVEVEEQHCALAAGCHAARHFLAQRLGQRVAVEESRHRVDAGGLVEQVVFFLAFGDIQQLHQAEQLAALDVRRPGHFQRQAHARMQREHGRLRHRVVDAGRFEAAEIIFHQFPRQLGQDVGQVPAYQVACLAEPQQAGATLVGHVDVAAAVADQKAMAQTIDGARIALLHLVLHRVDQAQHGQRLEHRRAGKPQQIPFGRHGGGADDIEDAARHQGTAQQPVAALGAVEAHAHPDHHQAQRGGAAGRNPGRVDAPQRIKAQDGGHGRCRNPAPVPAPQITEKILGATVISGHAGDQHGSAHKQAPLRR
uniref:Uncharacterized protein n=1 Tax=Tanacetum cinerariifolium TaxID=118510 RepID=A0A699GG52_TANCI|nr:hypothetical protein [Tanacetum cinerariifolium]